MDADDIRKYGIGCGVLMLGFLCFIYVMPFIRQSRHISNPNPVVQGSTTAKSPEQVQAPAPKAQKKNPSQILEEMSYGKDNSKAYDLAVKYFREGNDEEKLAAIKALPSMHIRLFEDAYARKSIDDARKIYELNKEILEQAAKLGDSKIPYNLKDGTRYMKEKLQELNVQNFKEILASKDAAKIDAAIEDAWKDHEAVLPERETTEYLAAAWSSAMEKAPGSAATQASLEKAADFAVQNIHDITYWKYRNGPLEAALCKHYQFKELADLARKSLQSGHPVAALAYSSAAIKSVSSSESKTSLRFGSEEWLDMQKLFCESMVGTAALAKDGKLRWLQPDTSTNKVEILLQMAIRTSMDASRNDKSAKTPETKFGIAVKAWDELFKLYRGKLARILSSGENHKIISYCDDRLYDGTYVSFLGECFGPEKALAGLPENIKKAVDKKAKTPNDRIFALAELIRLKEYSPQFPGKDEFLKASLQAKYETGTELFKEGKYPASFVYFREILRRYPDAKESSGIKDQLASKIEEARRSRDFNSVYYLASFMIGEIKSSFIPKDINMKLAECLESAAEFYKEASPMKRAFMLSLLSDLLAGTEKGRNARDEAMKIGFDAVRNLPLKGQEKPAILLPSVLKGCSIEAIKNSTPYHLMAFYDGPEKFFVRINPQSRGSLALLDGEYEIAVILTSDNVVPYRTKLKYEKEFFLNSYFISEPGREKIGEYPDSFIGNFSLLRVPGNYENAQIDRESGIIFQKIAE